MPRGSVFAGTAVALGVVALGHAAITWPTPATVVFFVGGACIAFLAEAIAVGRGWLTHHIGPKAFGVPLYVLFGWTGTIYVAFRIALLAADGSAAVLLAGALATAYDVLVDHRGVEAGHWTYTDDGSGLRFRGVPWWNFAGWFAISGVTAAITVPFV